MVVTPRGEENSDEEILLKRTTITLATTFIVAAIAAALLFSTITPDADARDRTELAKAQNQISALRAQLAAERKAHRQTLTRSRRAARAVRPAGAKPGVDHALKLAAATHGVSATKLRRVAICESTLNPDATNGQYVGLFQFGTPLWNTTPYRRFSRTDPYAAAAAAAWAFKRGMASHWPLCGKR